METVVDARTGQALNSGLVSLTYPDGTSDIATSIDADTRTFTLPFVPEGSYTLKVAGASETETTHTSDSMSRFPRGKKLRVYSEGTLPVVVQNDVMGLTIPVEKRPMPANGATH